MIRFCIFDLDGTLLNTATTITYYINKVFSRWGIDKISEEECKMFLGDGASKLIKRALTSKNIEDEAVFEKVLSEYNDAYNMNTLYLTEAYPGIYELMKGLQKAGIRMAVLSNKPDKTAKSVVKSFFGDSFDIVRGGMENVELKPNPMAAEQILNELSIDRNETAFIGDTSVDIKTGKNLGARLSIGVLWGFRDRKNLEQAGADLTVSSAEELLKEILSFNGKN